jgi:hypothetical protein
MSRPRAERSPDGKGRNHAVMALAKQELNAAIRLRALVYRN